jgi:hypothetical protein
VICRWLRLHRLCPLRQHLRRRVPQVPQAQNLGPGRGRGLVRPQPRQQLPHHPKPASIRLTPCVW